MIAGWNAWTPRGECQFFDAGWACPRSSAMIFCASSALLGVWRAEVLMEVQSLRFDPDATRKAHDKPAVGRPGAVCFLIAL